MSEDRFVEELRTRAEATPGAEVTPEQVWRGARHRRARHVGMTEAVALVAVGAVALGAAAGIPDDGRHTPAVADGTRLTATTPGDAADWPAVTIADPFGFQCGKLVPEIREPQGVGTLHLEPTAVVYPEDAGELPTEGYQPLDGLVMSQDDHWVVDAGMVNGTPSVLEAGRDTMDVPVVAFVRGGVVVGHLSIGVALVGGNFDEPVTWDPGDTVPGVGGGRIGACDPVEGVWQLPSGDYDAYVTHHVKTVPSPGPDPWSPGSTALVAEHFLTLAGGPYQVTLDEATPPGDPWEKDWAAGVRPGLEDVELDFGGLGPLMLGSAVPTEPAPIDMIEWLPDACPGTAEAGRWVSAYQPVWEPGQQPPFFWPTVREGRVVRIDLPFGMQTTEYVRVLGPLAAAQAAYEDLRPLTSADDTGLPVDTYVVERDGGTMVFEVAARADERAGIEAGHVGSVVGIILVGSLEDYDRPSWETYRCP